MSTPIRPCRYLGPNDECYYWDLHLRDDETIRCYPGGWECYEDDSWGCIFEGKWVEAINFVGERAKMDTLPEGLEHQIPDKYDEMLYLQIATTKPAKRPGEITPPPDDAEPAGIGS